ncbi:hypothetical protein C8Q80DRAFT_3020 [Daedaleopsis nitida]|nr:hypothetical protein C8Q80DRAFT_2527 [Daedaleopsis nitida]KAI0756039.1 hypothetical protein C8Q80DRAFT_3020 [Daedaleopsis nitida]
MRSRLFPLSTPIARQAPDPPTPCRSSRPPIPCSSGSLSRVSLVCSCYSSSGMHTVQLIAVDRVTRTLLPMIASEHTCTTCPVLTRPRTRSLPALSSNPPRSVVYATRSAPVWAPGSPLASHARSEYYIPAAVHAAPPSRPTLIRYATL